MNKDQSKPTHGIDAVMANPNARDRVIELFGYISANPPTAELPADEIIKAVDGLIAETKKEVMDGMNVEFKALIGRMHDRLDAPPKRTIIEDGVTCPSHTAQRGSDQTGLDQWEQRGPDRCCSYCGSFHPEDFIEFLKQAADPESPVRIERADNKSKWYVTRPEVSTYKEGGLKFYGFHARDHLDEINEILPEATQVSKIKFEKIFQERKESL